MLLFFKNKAVKLSILILGFLALVFVFPWAYTFYKIKPTKPIPALIKTKLGSLAQKSLESNDIPVAAILTYDDSILGLGYNTVLKDTVAYGHAEINAITSCLKKIGLEKFKRLDRSKLFLYTTLEPCEMCRGALIEYRIKRVFFMKSKDLNYWFKERNWEWVYEYNKSKVEGEEIQEDLFKQHPHYKSN